MIKKTFIKIKKYFYVKKIKKQMKKKSYKVKQAKNTKKSKNIKKANKQIKRRTKTQYRGDYNTNQIKLIKNRFRELDFNESEINNFLIELNRSSQFFADDMNKLLEQMTNFTSDNKDEVRNWVEEMGKISDNDNFTDINNSQLSQISSVPSSQYSQYSDNGYQSSQASQY